MTKIWKVWKILKEYKKNSSSKCYIVTGKKGIADKYFLSKREAFAFLMENTHRYDALMKCVGCFRM